MEILSIVAPESPPFSGAPGTTGPSTPGAVDWPAASTAPPAPLTPAALEGSWYLIVADGRRPTHQGTMRITREDGKLAVSADLYAMSRTTASPISDEIMIGANGAWYPQPALSDYRQHLRSMGGSAGPDNLTVNVRAFFWQPSDPTSDSKRVGDFSRFSDTTLTLRLEPGSYTVLDSAGPAPVLAGSMLLDSVPVDIRAAKTSPHARGLRVVVQEMEGCGWPPDPTYGPEALSAMFRNAGIDLNLVTHDTTIPHDRDLIRSELDAMLSDSVGHETVGSLWVQHLFLVSRLHWSGLDSSGLFGHIFGIMFDNTDRHRQGVAVFVDAVIDSSVSALDDRIDPAIFGKTLGSVPQVLLRTIAHEIGHGLGLKHSSADHVAGHGIMNQIQELLRQADPAAGILFPANAMMAFDAIDTRNLCHRPDPEVCPGWGNWSVPPKEVNLGLQAYPNRARSLQADRILDMRMVLKPANELAAPADRPALRRTFDLGEPVFVELTFSNATDAPVTVPTKITLVDGLSEVAIRDPGALRRRVIGTAQTVCEGTRQETLSPGETRRHILQLHSAGNSPVFSMTGDHVVELAIQTPEHGWIEAPSSIATVRPNMPQTRRAFGLTGRHPFCESIALGYLCSYRAISDTDRLIRSVEYPLGARLAAAVLQVATFADPGKKSTAARAAHIQPNAIRVDRALAHMRSSGITKAVALAIARAIDPLAGDDAPAITTIAKAFYKKP